MHKYTETHVLGCSLSTVHNKITLSATPRPSVRGLVKYNVMHSDIDYYIVVKKIKLNIHKDYGGVDEKSLGVVVSRVEVLWRFFTYFLLYIFY